MGNQFASLSNRIWRNVASTDKFNNSKSLNLKTANAHNTTHTNKHISIYAKTNCIKNPKTSALKIYILLFSCMRNLLRGNAFFSICNNKNRKITHTYIHIYIHMHEICSRTYPKMRPTDGRGRTGCYTCRKFVFANRMSHLKLLL